MDSINSALNELLKVVAAGAIAVATAWVRALIKKEVEKRHLEAIEKAAYGAVLWAEKQGKGSTGGAKFSAATELLKGMIPSADCAVRAAAIEVAHRDAGLEHPKEVDTVP